MSKKINLEDIAKDVFSDVRKEAFSHNMTPETSDILKEYLTDELSEAIINLKRIITENASIYRKIIDTEPKLFDDVFSMIDEINKKHSESSFTIDYSNFHKKLLTMPIVEDKELEYVDTEGVSVNLSENGKSQCVRNTYMEVLYAKRDNGNNKYKIGTYSDFYTYYVLKNNDLILADTISFDKHNTLVSISKNIHNLIEVCTENEVDKKRQKILFSYLVERGTGLNFKFLLYKYSLRFYEELLKLGLKKDDIDFLVKDYIYYLTMFRSVCMFPDDEFFLEAGRIVSHLIKSRMEFIKKNKYNTDLKNEVIFQICEGETERILDELFLYQNEATSNKNESEIKNKEFSNNAFSNPNDRASQHLKLWKRVQYFVNKHIESDYTNRYFNILPNNNVNAYKSLITFDKALKNRSLEI